MNQKKSLALIIQAFISAQKTTTTTNQPKIMFNRDKHGLDPESESYSVNHHVNTEQQSHGTVSTSTSNISITLKQIIRNILILTVITVLLRSLVSNSYSPIILLSQLRSFIYGIFHHHRPIGNEYTPIFGSLEFDTVESNPISVVRLLIVIILCLSMTIPFVI